MYTQCPDCDTAFRVTADVLKQAAGKVRCGGCGNAFNALAYLSEEMPGKPVAADPKPQVPEPKSDPARDDAAPIGPAAPDSVSAAQSAALLKTLDELAGSDIRIEDTGVEWRVFDDDEEDIGEQEPDPVNDTGSMKWFLEDEATPDSGEDAAAMADVFEKPGEAVVDEILDESPTPVDEILTHSPAAVEAGEIFGAGGDAKQGRLSIDELRFDDNTPLPDDFDFDDEPASVQPAPQPETPVLDRATAEDSQVDLAFGDVDDWSSLLDEVTPEADQPAAAARQPAGRQEPEPAEEPEPVESEREEPLDIDTQFLLQAEAMGIDLSGIHENADSAAEADDDADDDDDDVDIDAVEDSGERSAIDALAEDLAEAEAAIERSTSDEIEALGIIDFDDLSEAPDAGHVAAGEAGIGETDVDSPQADAVEAEVDANAIEQADEDDAAAGELDFDIRHADKDAAEELDFDLRLTDIDAAAEEPDLDIRLADEDAGAAELDFDIDLGDEDAGESAETEDHVVPPQTDEEQTINMQIDQDLMALAIEDDDGFASTIVKGSIEEILEEERQAAEAQKPDMDELPPIVETIVMEGEYVMSELERQRREAEAAEAADLAELGIRPDTREAEEAPVRGGRRSTDPPSSGKIAAAIVLGLVLLLQLLHQNREMLATIPMFNKTVGALYRLVGKPLQPDWNIAGWRFEARRDAVNDENETLTIYSRLGNKYEQPLPYPLISVALTDRFEEVIGNRIFEPNEYLAEGIDPRKAVAAGNTFEAVLPVGTLTPEATGYKLNVCYRIEGGKLSCAIEDFR